MNENESLEHDESLRKVLREWEVDAPLPPRFQAGVWERIARAETKPAGSLSLRSALTSFLNPFTRPAFALAYVVVLVTLGLAAGSRAAQMRTSRLDSDLKMRYIQSVDPFRTDISNP